MKSKIKSNYILIGITSVLLMTTAALLLLVLRSRFLIDKTDLTNTDSLNTQVSNIDIRNIDKITIKDRDGPGCIEITPDGAVRIYDICNDEIDKAFRSRDMIQISRLFKTISGQIENGLRAPPKRGEYYQVTMYLDDGDSYTVYLVKSDDGSQEDWIIDLIDDIVDDAPEPTLTPTSILTPTPTTIIYSTPTITPTPIPSYFPTPTPFAGDPEPEEMFSCDFSEEGIEGKPFRISNIVCTSEPE